MIDDNILDKALGKIKKTIGTEKFDDICSAPICNPCSDLKCLFPRFLIPTLV